MKTSLAVIVGVGLVGVLGAVAFSSYANSKKSTLTPRKVAEGVEIIEAAWQDGLDEIRVTVQNPESSEGNELYYLQLESGYLYPIMVNVGQDKSAAGNIPILPNVTKNPIYVMDSGGQTSAWDISGYVARSGNLPESTEGFEIEGLKHHEVKASATLSRIDLALPSGEAAFELVAKEPGHYAYFDGFQLADLVFKDRKCEPTFPEGVKTSFNNNRVELNRPEYATVSDVHVKFKGQEATLAPATVSNITVRDNNGDQEIVLSVNGLDFTFVVLEGRGGRSFALRQGHPNYYFQRGDDYFETNSPSAGKRFPFPEGDPQAFAKTIQVSELKDPHPFTGIGVIKAKVETTPSQS